ncbi:MAG: hypothetical protein OEY11_00835 [Gammaproteobacteria bacterium]|nr:hypothetical protein [Gammaproteobacteria bacterium]
MDDKKPLLQTIRDLYTKIFLVSLHKRINDYYPRVDSRQHHELNAALHNFINAIVHDVSQNSNQQQPDNLQQQDEQAEKKTVTSVRQLKPATPVSTALNTLSLYFKKNKALENDPSVAAKLKNCVWDHIHTAHRLARTGNATSAKTHANIATDALKTLSHYMPEEEYSELFSQINQQLKSDAEQPDAPADKTTAYD